MIFPVKSQSNIYGLTIRLIGTKPEIWRDIQVPGGIKLKKLHQVIQRAMGWEDCHLHQFVINGIKYIDPSMIDEELSIGEQDERKIKLEEVAGVGEVFEYIYDFGDYWKHEIEVEASFEPDPDEDLCDCVCLDGKRACPPEDSGGIHGYHDMVKALCNPKHPEHDHYKEWLGKEFNPNKIDLDKINKQLKKIKV